MHSRDYTDPIVGGRVGPVAEVVFFEHVQTSKLDSGPLAGGHVNGVQVGVRLLGEEAGVDSGN